MKVITVCGKHGKLTRSKVHKSGDRYRCKACALAAARNWYKGNVIYKNIDASLRQADDRDRVRRYQKAYRELKNGNSGYMRKYKTRQNELARIKLIKSVMNIKDINSPTTN